MEGLLKKLNSHGVWKDRYGQLSNAFFMTYKPKNKKPTSEIKETIDLRQTESVIIEGDTLKVTMDDGEVMVFKGDSLQLWLFAIQTRMEWIAKEADKHNSKSLTDMKRVHISGMLKKKSHNKYQGFQVGVVSASRVTGLICIVGSICRSGGKVSQVLQERKRRK